jgi:hypothetical protein
MKFISIALIALTSTLGSIAAWGQAAPVVIPTSFSKVYAPNGYDDNDKVQIVGEGLFPNSCYRYEDTKIKVNHESKTISLESSAYKYQGICLMVIVPFDQVLDVGLLQKGTYKIVEARSNQKLGEVSIKSAVKAEPDDFIYAPISQAFYKQGCFSDDIYLTGNFPLSCMKITDVQLHLQSDVVVVQPIVEIDASKSCVSGEFPFKKSVNASFLKPGRYMLHVRSMNGKAINSLVDVHPKSYLDCDASEDWGK